LAANGTLPATGRGIQFGQQGLRLRQLAQLIQAHGIQALEDVAAFAMQRGAAMGLVEAQDVLKARNDAFLARGAAGSLSGATSTPSASSSSSSSMSAIASLSLRLRGLGLRAVARKCGHALGHALFPGIG
jgi:hypothetical protein